MIGLRRHSPRLRELGLVGTANETDVVIGNIRAKALLDTGSTVSTLSKEFYDRHFQDQQIHPVTNILNIECADGKDLPYEGYIELDLNILGETGSQSRDNTFAIRPYLRVR